MNKSLLEKEIQKRKNLKQFKGMKFGRIISAELSIELEVRDRLKLSKVEYAEFKKKAEIWEQEKIQKRLDREEKERIRLKEETRQKERVEKMARDSIATMDWRRRNIPKQEFKNEFNSFKALALKWKESRDN